MNKIIRAYQSAFVEGKPISDNYIVAHEAIHILKKKRKEKAMGLKLDMVKVYDRMEWNFLHIV